MKPDYDELWEKYGSKDKHGYVDLMRRDSFFAALDEARRPLIDLLREGAHLSEYEEPDEGVVADFRQRCAKVLKRLGIKL
jgi:hypothetical protein